MPLTKVCSKLRKDKARRKREMKASGKPNLASEKLSLSVDQLRLELSQVEKDI